jgi:AbrB family looped-hinge helix DNA binding protein
MSIIRLSSKGQIVIPKAIRDKHRWTEGQELELTDSNEGLVLREKRPFNKTDLKDVAGCLPYSGNAKTLEEMEMAIVQGALHSANKDDQR